MLTRRARHIADDVTLSVLPWAVLDAVLGLPGRPETEAIVMLRHHYHVLRARGFDGAHPLIWIELSRVENRRNRGAIAPLAIQKSVGREMKNDSELKVLPIGLLRRWLDVGKVLRERREQRHTCHHQRRQCDANQPEDRSHPVSPIVNYCSLPSARNFLTRLETASASQLMMICAHAP